MSVFSEQQKKSLSENFRLKNEVKQMKIMLEEQTKTILKLRIKVKDLESNKNNES